MESHRIGLARLKLLVVIGGLLACDGFSEPSDSSQPLPTTPLASALPQGRLLRDIVFVSDRDRNSEIYSMTSIGTQQTNLSQHPAEDFDPSWSPDGQRVAFVRRTADRSDIWIMSASGTGQISVGLPLVRGTPRYAEVPRWSPDGTRLAFVRGSSPGAPGDLYVVTAGAAVMEKKLTAGGGVVSPPEWSPDGRRLAFVRGPSGSQFLYRIDADGTALTQLAPARIYNATQRNRNPCWGAQSLILYTNLVDYQFQNGLEHRIEVFSIHPSGGAPVQRTNTLDSDGGGPITIGVASACWSPDASRILATVPFETGSEMFITKSDGVWLGGGWATLNLWGDQVHTIDRGFSSDGTRVLFYRNEPPWHDDDDFQVWTVRTDHTGPTTLTALGSNTDPDWWP